MRSQRDYEPSFWMQIYRGYTGRSINVSRADGLLVTNPFDISVTGTITGELMMLTPFYTPLSQDTRVTSLDRYRNVTSKNWVATTVVGRVLAIAVVPGSVGDDDMGRFQLPPPWTPEGGAGGDGGEAPASHGGAGGCGCRAEGGGTSAEAAVALFAMLALAERRRLGRFARQPRGPGKQSACPATSGGCET